MKTQLNLGPVELLQKEIKKKSFNPIRLLVTILFLFLVGSGGFYLATMALKAIGPKEEIEYKQLEVDDLKSVQFTDGLTKSEVFSQVGRPSSMLDNTFDKKFHFFFPLFCTLVIKSLHWMYGNAEKRLPPAETPAALSRRLSDWR
ncbi:MAG: hypothetical protein LBL51_03940 [Synergistaceae bacterium]|jgi:hypothetical protein|nr:hypothetical protein [Synergistaceae bacterium]